MDIDAATVKAWLNLLVRWFHVFAGILWIGTTYYFTWLDGRFSEADREAGDEAGRVWMVHSGGFYTVEKQKSPQLLTQKLHWFRWEAALTWLSGMTLLILIYYIGGLLMDADITVSFRTSALVGLGLLVVGWIVYDLLSQTPLGKNDYLFAAVSYLIVAAVAYGLTKVMSGRAVYMHVGAMFGTIMAANVWMRILPAQRQLIAATKAGQPADQALASRAKLRSKHNTYIVVPVIFTMLNEHFASQTDGYNWMVLMVLILVGWVAAKFIRRA
jgi:uncharacterized membrane protein